MSQGMNPQVIEKQVQHATKQVTNNQWFDRLARAGYVANGIVYALTGALTARAAFGYGGSVTDKQGALQTVLGSPFGQILLVLIGVGLVGYALFRLVQAILDPGHENDGAKRLPARLGYILSAVVYGLLAYTALRLAAGVPTSNGSSEQDLVARVFSVPLGRWLVGFVGLGVIGAGMFQLYRSYKTNFSERMRWGEMSAAERTWAVRLGRIGLAARGVVYGVIGFYLVEAALRFDPTVAQNSSGAMSALARLPFGGWLLGVVALGLVSYGLYMFAAARYSRVT